MKRRIHFADASRVSSTAAALTAMVVCAPFISPAAFADGAKTGFTDSGYVWRDGDMRVELGGRLQLDALNADSNQRSIGTKAGLRRAGLSLSVDWNNELEASVSAAFDENGAALSTLSLTYAGLENARFRIGKFGGLVGMERRGSSDDTLMMERALPVALTSRPAWGASAAYAANGFSGEVSYFTDWQENDVGTRGSDGQGFAGRLAYRFGNDDLSAHIGISGEWREPDEQKFRVRSRPEADLVSSRLIDTRLLTDVDKRRTTGVEGAVLAGPVTLQAEYLTSTLERTGGDVDLSGGYVQIGWIVTGESRRYRDRAAALGRVVGEGSVGAVELVARYSALDLSDGTLQGGEANVISGGVNWFVTPYLRLSFDGGRAEGDPNRSGSHENINFIEGRLQLAL